MAQSKAHVQRILAITIPFLWAVIVFFMHVIPVNPQKVSQFLIPYADKIVHLAIFLVLAFLWRRAQLFFHPRTSWRLLLVIVAACSAYGGLLEWLQSRLSLNRVSDWKDWMTDVLGILIGTWLAGKKMLSVFFGHQIGETQQDLL